MYRRSVCSVQCDYVDCSCFVFSADTETTEIYTLSLHDALPISPIRKSRRRATRRPSQACATGYRDGRAGFSPNAACATRRSEEHTSELQSRENLVCRLLLEKKKKRRKKKITELGAKEPMSIPQC